MDTCRIDAEIRARIEVAAADLADLVRREAMRAVELAFAEAGGRDVSRRAPRAQPQSGPRPRLAPYELTPARRRKLPAPVSAESPVSFERYERMAIHRALAECDGDLLAAARLLRVGKSTLYRRMQTLGIPRPQQGGAVALAETEPAVTTKKPVSLDLYERMALERALEESGGDRFAAAKLLKVGKSTVYRLLGKYGIG